MNMAETAGSVRSLTTRVIITASLLALFSGIAALALGRTDYAISLVSGAAAAIASFIVLVLTIMRTLGGRGGLGRSGVAVLAVGFLKLALLGTVIWWLVSRRMIEPFTFLGGFSTVVLALIVEGIRVNRKA